MVIHGMTDPVSYQEEEFLSGCTFDLVSVIPINCTCAVKNDTPIICTVGVKVQMGFDP